jgi:hypothetical protein
MHAISSLQVFHDDIFFGFGQSLPSACRFFM